MNLNRYQGAIIFFNIFQNILSPTFSQIFWVEIIIFFSKKLPWIFFQSFFMEKTGGKI